MSDAWTILEEDGILEDRLIQRMWGGFLDHKEALVQLMVKFDLICEAPVERLQQEQQDEADTEVNLPLIGAPAAMPRVLSYQKYRVGLWLQLGFQLRVLVHC